MRPSAPALPIRIAIALLPALALGRSCDAADATLRTDAGRRYEQAIRPLLERSCVRCHGGDRMKGDVDLARLASADAALADRALWRTVARQLRAGAMPPPEERAQPTLGERSMLLAWIASLAALDHPHAGYVPPRRLNRTEYEQTMADLLLVPCDAAQELPRDDLADGFPNQAETLSLSPLLMEKYLAAAERALDRAIVPGQLRLAWQAGRLAATVEGRAQPPTGQDARTFAGAGEIAIPVTLPSAGRYTVAVTAAAEQAGSEPARLAVSLGDAAATDLAVLAPIKAPRRLTATFTAAAGPQRLVIAFANPFTETPAPGGARRQPPRPPAGAPPARAQTRTVALAAIELTGPPGRQPPPTQAKLLIATPGKEVAKADAARTTLAAFASRAYRRPVDRPDLELLLRVFDAADRAGELYEESIKLAMKAALLSPRFLYRLEPPRPAEDAEGAYALDDWELASRLSYFLWSTMPDQALLDAAAAGSLHEPLALRQQASRLLADRRSALFIEQFATHWLELRGLQSQPFDPTLFPEATPGLRADLVAEAVAMVDAVVRDDRSVLELIDGDWTFLNERLARHYGVAGVTGPQLRRVTVGGGRRGGLVGLGAVLAGTSFATRTSVVNRGKWVLTELLDLPPSPPPMMAAKLEAQAGADADGRPRSLRQRLERHRADAACASCHAAMDPLGFGLENYDPLGRWRDRDGELPIDSSGVLDGRAFAGPAELKRLLRGRADEFVRCLVVKLLTYALGRRVDARDDATVAAIARDAAAAGYRFSAIIGGVVASRPFRAQQPPRPETP